MATAVVMPKLGNTMESAIIVAWKRAVGDKVAAGEVLGEVETDKAVMEVTSPEAGTLLALFYAVGDEVPVMTSIAAVGAAGEEISALRPHPGGEAAKGGAAAPKEEPPAAAPPALAPAPAGATVSPRARSLAERKGVDAALLGGSGPGGRVIERDVQAALAAQLKLTPVARAMVASGGYAAPPQGSGPGGRVMAQDLRTRGAEAAELPAAALPVPPPSAEETEVIPVQGVRKVIAERMLASLQTTAQLTLHASADARAVQSYRQRLKASPAELGLGGITINDLVLFAVSRALLQHRSLNALFANGAVTLHRSVHLGVAVDTSRGLMVPVIRRADRLTLRELAGEAKRLAAACLESKILPDELGGGTFTVTNLGAFGVESFTPVLNPPQVAILGVGNINLKPVQREERVEFVPHIGLSLTINHQVVDGAPAARFLQTLSEGIAQIELWLAL